ncbi:LysR family transcriptional regulator [Pseudoalteromonas denitrificans]|uniref:DNA-binding transcriptional regulator, LysR family n=1 Tax=Pseudoalteromonas denitrificans DSM 6059 TaxID=1123010 RepID=A0A1I1LLY6_9GAMM|nr:LysR family transcriptional regulator [Pseudoalteromonas denitrificans]SFC74227.1 DNA-binding transcriptional regulator, LysR family [Pseudoalteromonas denitrificans DSM 6059]
MNWDDLRYFLALARLNTVSAAGRDLGVKHTTVSRRIKALEQQLKTRLFDQLHYGYALTQAGENLYPHAVIMEEQAHSLDRNILGLDSQLEGRLKLTAAHDVFSRLVIPHLGLFKRAYPKIDLQLLGATGLADLSARQADIALRLTAKPPDNLIGKRVLPLTLGIYASKKYLDSLDDINHPKDAVLWQDEQIPDWLNQHFSSCNVTVRANDVTTILACLNNHMGIARIPCYLGDSSPELRRIDIPLSPSKWSVWVLSHVDLRATARVRACRTFLIDIIKGQENLISGLQSQYYR